MEYASVRLRCEVEGIEIDIQVAADQREPVPVILRGPLQPRRLFTRTRQAIPPLQRAIERLHGGALTFFFSRAVSEAGT